MILSDKQIKKLANEEGMINPFVSKSISKGISHGLNSFGYDLRCGSEFKIFTNIKGATADPKNFSEDNFITIEGEDSILIPPNSFALASSLEYFKMPRNVTGLVTAKSTYARCGLGTPPTVLEAGWHGNLVLEFSNHTSNSIRLYANSGAAQILFFQGEQPEVSYADREGKYQGQRGITLAKFK
jgi:dCTP deaminase|tara:strand:+ start:1200 stop:1751 length:552 start_codon:yes stop_codon:yes gene_type:complete